MQKSLFQIDDIVMMGKHLRRRNHLGTICHVHQRNGRWYCIVRYYPFLSEDGSFYKKTSKTAKKKKFNNPQSSYTLLHRPVSDPGLAFDWVDGVDWDSHPEDRFDLVKPKPLNIPELINKHISVKVAKPKSRLRAIRLKYFKSDPYCVYCNAKIPNFEKTTLDHIIPRSKHGSDREDNLILCCEKCNNDKGDTSYLGDGLEYLDGNQEWVDFLKNSKQFKRNYKFNVGDIVKMGRLSSLKTLALVVDRFYKGEQAHYALHYWKKVGKGSWYKPVRNTKQKTLKALCDEPDISLVVRPTAAQLVHGGLKSRTQFDLQKVKHATNAV